jgi:cytochrome c oxidase subunit 2
MLLIGVIAVAIAIPAALLIPWFPADASTQASNVRTLYDVLLIVSIPIFVLVETVIGYSIWKFRMRPGEEEKDGPPIHGNTRLEVVWTALPAILILGLCTYAYTVLRSNEKTHPGAMLVNVTERQFAFEFSYPEAGGKQIVTPELYLPKDDPVVFKLRSLDVIHSFFVPQFSEKIDAVPGITTTLRVTPTRIGTYAAECTELCGPGHSLMRAAVRVVTPAAFKTWLGSQKPNAPPPVGIPPANDAQPGVPTGAGAAVSSSAGSSSATSAAAGKTIFTGAGGCGACHTLGAAGTTGTIGPDLTQRLKSDCALPASMKIRGKTLSQCITTAITKPYAYLPSGYKAGIMPSTFAQTLGPTQIQALVTYLSSVTK